MQCCRNSIQHDNHDSLSTSLSASIPKTNLFVHATILVGSQQKKLNRVTSVGRGSCLRTTGRTRALSIKSVQPYLNVDQFSGSLSLTMLSLTSFVGC